MAESSLTSGFSLNALKMFVYRVLFQIFEKIFLDFTIFRLRNAPVTVLGCGHRLLATYGSNAAERILRDWLTGLL